MYRTPDDVEGDGASIIKRHSRECMLYQLRLFPTEFTDMLIDYQFY